MIEVVNISKSFENKKVLQDISVKFERGKTNLIIGQSGSGKTVLMKCIIGLLSIDSGKILYDNRHFSEMTLNEQKLIRQEIGMMFQGGALFDSMNVEENVMFPINMFTNQHYQEKRDRVDFCLRRVNLENVNKLYPSELSGGMKKKSCNCKSNINEPKISVL